MKKLYDIQRVTLEQFDDQAFYYRNVLKKISLDNAITGILGNRGIGKTTYLLHTAISYNKKQAGSALYVSADNPFFLTHSLLDVADYLYKETDTKLLCIDEIHKYSNWEQELKNIADIYKKIKVLFTGSSMIDIAHSKFDLSRRVTLHHLGGLSFREYLEFYLGQVIPSVPLQDLITKHIAIANSLEIKQILKHFRSYLKNSYYFFSKELSIENDKYQAIDNIAKKTIYEDIGLLHKLKTPTLYSIEQAFKFILNSAPGELNTNTLANLLSKSYDQTTSFIQWLEQSGLIICLENNKRGKAFIKTTKKLLPENTNLMYAAYLPQTEEQMIGKVREAFFANQFKNAKQKIFYSKTGDFESDKFIFEIGGKNKSNHQIKSEKNAFVVADDILVGDKQTIPLYLFGLLY
jgi:uncharacterized protein